MRKEVFSVEISLMLMLLQLSHQHHLLAIRATVEAGAVLGQDVSLSTFPVFLVDFENALVESLCRNGESAVPGPVIIRRVHEFSTDFSQHVLGIDPLVLRHSLQRRELIVAVTLTECP